ncbi:WRKY DNA-binding protein 7 isoform 3 [Hibiscus syriacus]|uniref:WRKY DNA-binding protein 7 isoform 3 n=1 Tax=Hibiscus syriacus TaxID=106335 RepID=A0A6A3ALD1_HIBSY|nr:WRKY DNA-binding protein 7 isoform 3 [Hibiscus syriacus]
MEENAVQEAASGIESVEKLISLLSQTQQQQNNGSDLSMDCKAVADVAVSKFKRVISLLGRSRTGHARFRRAPANQEPETKAVYHATPLQQIPPPHHPPHRDHELLTQPSSSSAFQITNLSQVSSAGKPLFCSSLKRKCSSENLGSGKCSSCSGRCHCSKKRKMRSKRFVRVPAISLKLADIPPDDYSWRKYGQKPIKDLHILGVTISAAV